MAASLMPASSAASGSVMAKPKNSAMETREISVPAFNGVTMCRVGQAGQHALPGLVTILIGGYWGVERAADRFERKKFRK